MKINSSLLNQGLYIFDTTKYTSKRQRCSLSIIPSIKIYSTICENRKNKQDFFPSNSCMQHVQTALLPRYLFLQLQSHLVQVQFPQFQPDHVVLRVDNCVPPSRVLGLSWIPSWVSKMSTTAALPRSAALDNDVPNIISLVNVGVLSRQNNIFTAS